MQKVPGMEALPLCGMAGCLHVACGQPQPGGVVMHAGELTRASGHEMCITNSSPAASLTPPILEVCGLVDLGSIQHLPEQHFANQRLLCAPGLPDAPCLLRRMLMGKEIAAAE